MSNINRRNKQSQSPRQVFDVVAWCGTGRNFPGSLAMVAHKLHAVGIDREVMTSEVSGDQQKLQVLGVGTVESATIAENILNDPRFTEVKILPSSRSGLTMQDVRVRSMSVHPSSNDFFITADLPYDSSVPSDVLSLSAIKSTVDIRLYSQVADELDGFCNIRFSAAGVLLEGKTIADLRNAVADIVEIIGKSWMAVNGRRWQAYFREVKNMIPLAEAPTFYRIEDLSKYGDVG